MNKVYLIFFILVVSLIHGCAAQNALYSTYETSQDENEKIILYGFAFIPPKQAKWQNFGHEPFLVKLGTHGDRPLETYSIFAKIFYLHDLDAPEDLIHIGKKASTAGLLPPRYKLLSIDSDIDAVRNELCALTYTIYEDCCVPNRPSKYGSMHMQSKYLLCQHPIDNNVGIVVGYSRRHDIGDKDDAFERKSGELFDSLVFTEIPSQRIPELKDPESIYALGVSYAKGDGVPQDIVVAVKLCRHAAEQGVAEAQHDLGSMYADGTGVIQDDIEAVRWFKAAANQGYDRAQNYLGLMYENGRGVPVNNELAMTWYKMAAEQGYAMAQVNIGSMYAKGEGVTQDYKQAARWYEMAAKQGQVNAQFSLGYFYYLGLGVSQDYIQAYKWFSLAHINGHNEAFATRNTVASKMNQDQIDYAEKLAREWAEDHRD